MACHIATCHLPLITDHSSGEDGALGGPLSAAFVRGVQSEGVAAVVKHWVSHKW